MKYKLKHKPRPSRYRLLPPTYAEHGAKQFLQEIGFTKIRRSTYDGNRVLIVYGDEFTEERERILHKLHWAILMIRYEGPKPPWYRPAQA